MNASPDFTAQPALMWMLIPALICLFGIVIGIVTAFRHGDARVPLAIGGLGFVALLFSLPFTSTPGRVPSSPIAFEHSASSPMQPMPVFNTHLVAWPLLALIVGATFVGIVAAIRHGYGKVVLVVGAVAIVGFFVVGFSSLKVHEQTGPTNIQHVVSVTPMEVTPTGPAPSQILYTTGNAQPIPIQELPGWRKNPPHEGSLGAGWSKYVLTSEQFATVEEAENELYKTLTADVQQGFAYHHPATTGWVPTRDDIQVSGLIAERVIETLPLKVGEFENTVHRVSWLVEFKPETNQALHARWEPVEAQRRSKLILSILAGASGVLGVAAVTLRRRKATVTTTSPQATA